jgi:beta-N-acetylhexosaminidase
MNETELDRLAAKMFVVGFHGTSVPREMGDLIRRGVSGAVLFSRNATSANEVARLCRQLKDAADRPFLTCIDHEGGRIVRAREGFTPIATMREIGRTRDPAQARSIGITIGRELRAANIDLNFAPVVDVDTIPANPVIGDRSFSDDPNFVSQLSCALIEGMQSQGVAACAKHFPGHGDTSIDSHLDLPTLNHDLSRLRAVELPPFRAAVRAGVASVMTAHVIFRALDAENPATMSRPVLAILRDEFGFDGVIISDDLEMKAIADHFGVERAVVRGVNAGVDLFLVCHSHEMQHRAIDALVQAVKSGEVSRDLLTRSSERINNLIESFEA